MWSNGKLRLIVRSINGIYIASTPRFSIISIICSFIMCSLFPSFLLSRRLWCRQTNADTSLTTTGYRIRYERLIHVASHDCNKQTALSADDFLYPSSARDGKNTHKLISEHYLECAEANGKVTFITYSFGIAHSLETHHSSISSSNDIIYINI